MDSGLLHDFPLPTLFHGTARRIGDDACFAGGNLYVVASAGTGEILGRHHQCQLMHAGIVDYGKGACGAVGGSEHEDAVARLNVGGSRQKHALIVGAREEKAKLQTETARLEELNTRKELWKTVETLHQNVLSAQSRYVAATNSVTMADQLSYRSASDWPR